MALFFHVVEQDDGRWACRHGRHEYDTHDTLEQATEHIRVLAYESRPASIFVHHLDGTTVRVEDIT
jgi:hypothetical protein